MKWVISKGSMTFFLMKKMMHQLLKAVFVQNNISPFRWVEKLTSFQIVEIKSIKTCSTKEFTCVVNKRWKTVIINFQTPVRFIFKLHWRSFIYLILLLYVWCRLWSKLSPKFQVPPKFTYLPRKVSLGSSLFFFSPFSFSEIHPLICLRHKHSTK